MLRQGASPQAAGHSSPEHGEARAAAADARSVGIAQAVVGGLGRNEREVGTCLWPTQNGLSVWRIC